MPDDFSLRHLACIQRHGAHFRDGCNQPDGHFGCKHCGLYNLSPEFHETGISVWKYSSGLVSISCWKNQENILTKANVSEKEVSHALQLVGYRATGDDPDE